MKPAMAITIIIAEKIPNKNSETAVLSAVSTRSFLIGPDFADSDLFDLDREFDFAASSYFKFLYFIFYFILK